MMSERSQTWILAWMVLGLAIVAYANSVHGRFVWDDRMLILSDPAVRSLQNLGDAFRSDFFARAETPTPYGYYRPLTTASYALDRALWGLRPFGFHLTNVALHALASVLGFLFLLRLGFSRGLAAVIAALFAVHPVHTENVAWIAGRTDLLTFVLGMGAILLHCVAWPFVPRSDASSRSKKRRSKAPPHPPASVHAGLEILALILFAMALFAKEMAVVIPAWIFLLHLLGRRDGWRRSTYAVIPYGLVFAVYLVVRFAIVHVPTPDPVPGAGFIAALMTLPLTVLRYIGWLISPSSPSAYVQNPYVQTLVDPRFWVALLGLGLLGVGLIRQAHKNSRVGLLAVMFAVSLVPVLNFVRVASPADMGDTMAARFCYMPSLVFLALVAVLLSESKWFRHGWAGILVTVLIVVSLVNTWRRNNDWHDEKTLFTKTVAHVPNAPLPWVRLGFAYLRSGELEEARRAIARASSLQPNSGLVLNARVNLLAFEGRVQDALPLQRRVVELAGRARTVQLNNLAYLERMNGHLEKAQKILEQLISTGHASSDVWFNLAEVQRARGKNDAALDAFSKALAGDPRNVAKLFRAGDFEQQLGHFASAQAMYERALEEQPGNAKVRLCLADLLAREGRRQDAISHLMILRHNIQDPRVQMAVKSRLKLLSGDRHDAASHQPEEPSSQ